jgi:hypothetical protein
VTTGVLRLLEGYWPKRADCLKRALTARMQRQQANDRQAWQLLHSSKAADGRLTPAESAEWARLDLRLHRRPGDPDELMPTRIGNILRAAENLPRVKYGLDTVIVWPRLWLVMPESARQELVIARGKLDTSVAAAVWALLFTVVVPTALLLSPSHSISLSCLAVLLGLVTAWVSIAGWVPARAEVFADLLDSAFDLYRCFLYQQLRWPMPKHPAHERLIGPQLTSYLWRGSDAATPRFISSQT